MPVRLLRSFAALVALTVTAVSLSTVTAEAAGTKRRYIVRFADGTSAGSGATSVDAQGADVERTLRHVFAGAVVTATDAEARAMRQNPKVAAVELDSVVVATDVQSNPTWGLDRIDQRALPLSASYTYRGTGAGVSAYVVDTGVLAGHVELSGRVRSGYSAIADGRGTADCHGHGTHVAGTVAGTVYGVAKAASVVAVRVLGCDGSGTLSGVVAGLDWIVADHVAGVPAVVNLSLGGGASSTLDAAVGRVIADGVTVAVAAGNSKLDACTQSPARVPGAVTVGASDRYDARASYSNYGQCLDLFAPGSSITSAGISSTTAIATMSGTSMATPHVAGAAAVLLSLEPGLTATDVTARLLGDATTGLPTNPGTGSPQRLLFLDGVAPAPAPEPEPTPDPAPDPDPAPVVTAPAAPTQVTAVAAKRAVSLSWTQGADGGAAITSQTVRGYVSGKLAVTLQVAGTATSANVSGLRSDRSYTFTVTATNSAGTSPASAPSNAVRPLK